MSISLFALALLSAVAHAEECPISAEQKIKSYYREPVFQAAFASQIELFSGFKVKKLELLKPDYPGDSHAGLPSTFVPSGLARIGEGTDVMNDVAFRTNEKSGSLVLESEGHKLTAQFRFDDWTLCQNGKIVQPWVSIEGFISEGENDHWVKYIWDYEKNLVLGPSPANNLLQCFSEGLESVPMPFIWDFGVAVLPTAEHGRYFINFGFGEQGSFALANCRLTTNTSLLCEGEEVHSVSLSWLGLVDGKPDAIDLQISERNSSGTRQELLAKTHFICK